MALPPVSAAAPPTPRGYFALVLHAHLPFTRHPEHERFFEEDWLYEAITETYIPLIEAMDGWETDGIPWMLTLSVTPPLAAMLRDELLQQRYRRHIGELIELMEKEQVRLAAFQGPEADDFRATARMYLDRFRRAHEVFDAHGGDLTRAFRRLADTGRLEILTCGATHGFLPLMLAHPPAARAQLGIAQAAHTRVFGRKARGIWLPECGFAPGVDELLAAADLRFFFVDSHGLLDANPAPIFGVHAPYATPAGPTAFARDPESSRQVWSAEVGYPGDPVYREFYRDLGWDGPYDYVRPYIQPTGDRKNLGVKYHRITGKVALGDKAAYRRDEALGRVREHAANFLFNRERQVEHLRGILGIPPIVVSPYDAELFGHWWYEGPEFIDAFMRHAALRRLDPTGPIVEPIHPAAYLERFPQRQVGMPAPSSWGDGGYADVWLNEGNQWIQRPLLAAARRMTRLADAAPSDPAALHARALRQAVRELLLAQSSDWAFLMRTGTAVNYAARRTRDHLARFQHLAEQIESGSIDEPWLGALEARDNLFAEEADWRWYRSG